MDDLDINKFIEENRIEFKEYSENDTYVIHDLKMAARNQLVWQYLKAMGIPDETNTMSAAYYYYQGRYKKIDRKYIYMCRNRVQPSKWFCRYTEELPERIKFTEKYSYERLMTEYTVGHLLMLNYSQELTFPGLAERYGIKKDMLKNTAYKVHNEIIGKEILRIQPPDEVINGLKEIINPDWWFIFPDEAEKLPDRLK